MTFPMVACQPSRRQKERKKKDNNDKANLLIKSIKKLSFNTFTMAAKAEKDASRTSGVPSFRHYTENNN